MDNGIAYKSGMYCPKGDPSNPLSDDELRDKFRSNVADLAEGTKSDALIQMIENPSELRNLSDLMSRLRSPGAA
jgi:2-methylcitrate dehydratase PrpD